jgi:hypothetical protein
VRQAFGPALMQVMQLGSQEPQMVSEEELQAAA